MKPKKPSQPDTSYLERICTKCHWGVFRPNYTYPHKYKTCSLCGFTVEVEMKGSQVVLTSSDTSKG